MAFPVFAKMTHLQIYTCISLILLAGCAVQDTHQAKLDQKQLRDVLMDYTQDQILDNLIRAYHGLPIVHFDFARISAGVTSKIVPVVGGGQSVTNVQTRTPTHTSVTTDQTTATTVAPAGETVVNSVVKTLSAVGGAVETVVRPFNYTIGAERDNVISLDVKPVLDDRTVYAAYVSFLNCHNPYWSCAPKEETQPVNKVTTTEEEPTTVTKTTETTVRVGPDGKVPEPTPPSIDTKHTTENLKKKVSSTVTEKGMQKAFGWEITGSIQSLQCTASPPPKGGAVVCKLWKDNNYYWVPVDYQKAFFALCLATVARGKPAASSGAAEVTSQLEDFQSQQQQQFLQSR